MHPLKKWRLARGLTQEQSALAVGVTQMSWSRYERGDVPEPAVMRRIVDFVGGAVTPNDFFAPAGDVAGEAVDEAAA